MKQLNLTILLTLLMNIIEMPLAAHDIEVQNSSGKTIYYNFLNSSEVAVCSRGYYSDYSNEYTGHVELPETVTYNGKTYRVTKIYDWAFYECPGLTSLSIPNSITEIWSCAFMGCSGLSYINIPNSVTYIGSGSFSRCI